MATPPFSSRRIAALTSLTTLSWTLAAAAQQADPAPPAAGAAPAPAPAEPRAPVNPEAPGQEPGQPTQGSSSTVYVPYGLPAPGTDLNPGLPSSSRPSSNTESFSDGFDLGPSTGDQAVVRGRPGAAAVLGDEQERGPALRVPNIHTVRRGDTLWDLSDHYYGNPWQWPRLWSYNPHIENPHWIYPGDQLRMRSNGLGGAGDGSGRDGAAARSALMGGGATGEGPGGRRSGLQPNTVMLRNQGFIEDPKRDNWGELVGSREDQMLLSEGNTVYLQMREGVSTRPGQLLTLYRFAPKHKVKGAREPRGEVVAVKGTVRVDAFDPDTRMARGRIVESVDVIERGAKVGPVGRRFMMVAPKVSDVTLRARVLNSLYPHVYLAQNQLVFLDRGSKDGLKVGFRLVVIRRGDSWRQTLGGTAGMARDQIILESPENVDIEETPLRGEPDKFPEEIVGELRVLKTQDESSVAVVTSSSKEIVPGDVAVARRGY